MTTSPYLIPDLEAQEGIRLKPYPDSRGIWTVGCGHNLQVDPTLYPQLAHLITIGITRAQCDALLAADIAHVTTKFDVLIPWWNEVPPIRADVLVNIAFNVGMAQFLTWHHTLDYAQAALWVACGDEIAATQPWASQVGRRSKILADQMRTGQHA